jgi:peroxiredoxin
VVISLEDQETAKATQADFPHLVVVADEDRKLSEALEVIHRQSAPDGKDTTAPTTFLVDGAGKVRWTFRPERFLVRLTPAELLAAVDERIAGN